MDTQEVVRLLNTLQRTIANQNQAIEDLQKQLTRIEKQNKDLIEAQKQLESPNKEEVKALPDAKENLIEDRKQDDSTSVKDESQEKEDSHEILAKAKENAKKRATANVHRTLEDMQVPVVKKHWWQRFLNL